MPINERAYGIRLRVLLLSYRNRQRCQGIKMFGNQDSGGHQQGWLSLEGPHLGVLKAFRALPATWQPRLATQRAKLTLASTQLLRSLLGLQKMQ